MLYVGFFIVALVALMLVASLVDRLLSRQSAQVARRKKQIAEKQAERSEQS
jgi:membrane protein implicated in regulation of membrane protease activity